MLGKQYVPFEMVPFQGQKSSEFSGWWATQRISARGGISVGERFSLFLIETPLVTVNILFPRLPNTVALEVLGPQQKLPKRSNLSRYLED